MRKIATLLLAWGLLLAMAFGQGGIIPSVAPALAVSANGAVGPAGLITSSGLVITVSPGPIYCQGAIGLLGATTFTLAASTSYTAGVACQDAVPFVRIACVAQSFTGSNPGVSAPCVGNPLGPNEIALATIITGASTVSTNTDLRALLNFPLVTDGYYWVPPGACSIINSGGTQTGTVGLQGVGANNINVWQLATTTTTATDSITCDISPPTKITASKGAVINDVVLAYGNSTGATGTCNAPSIGTIALPTPGAGETASTAAPVAISGALTVTPVVGSCNTVAVTAGQFYSEKVALATPFSVVTDLQRLVFQQALVGPAAASYTLYVGGVIVHYTVPMLYN